MKKLGWSGSLAVYVPAALLLYVITAYAIPWFSRKTGQETIFSWFLLAGLGVFVPLIITGTLILRREGFRLSKRTWVERMRFRRLTGKDLAWALGGLLAVGVGSVLVMKAAELIAGSYDPTPPFMAFEPLSTGRYWLLLAWAPFWILNILGEEILWRGVMLPRQELAFGRRAWIVHGLGWMLFHAAFGWQLLVTLIPLIFIQSYVVQRTKNSWLGVILHGGINGPSFLAIAFGLLR